MMMPFRTARLVVLVVVLLTGAVSAARAAQAAGSSAGAPAPARAAAAQPPAAAPAQTPAAGQADLPVTDAQLNRIKRAISSGPPLQLNDQQLRFYVQILAREPIFTDFMRGYDVINGPTRRGNPMTYQEYVTMVTPKELHSSGGITPVELLQFALTNWIGQTLVKRAFEDMSHAKDDRELNEIRDRIDGELAAIQATSAKPAPAPPAETTPATTAPVAPDAPTK